MFSDDTQLMFVGGCAIFLIASIVIIYLGSLLEPPRLTHKKYCKLYRRIHG